MQHGDMVRYWKLMASAILAAFLAKMLGVPSCQRRLAATSPFSRIRALLAFFLSSFSPFTCWSNILKVKEWRLLSGSIWFIFPITMMAVIGCNCGALFNSWVDLEVGRCMFGRTSSHTKMAQARIQPSCWSLVRLCSSTGLSTTDWDFLCMHVYLS